jgi:hypothetical protein
MKAKLVLRATYENNSFIEVRSLDYSPETKTFIVGTRGSEVVEIQAN